MGTADRAARPVWQGPSALSRPDRQAQAEHMPTDALNILIGLAALIFVAVTLGLLSARLFVSASKR